MNAGAKIQCLTTWLLPNMVSVEGFEPSFSSSQAKRINLPFPHRALVPPTGFEPVRISPPDPKSGVSTSSTTEANLFFWQDRRDLNPQLLGRQPSALTIWTTVLYWWEETESNRWHVDFQSTALTNWAIFPIGSPTENWTPISWLKTRYPKPLDDRAILVVAVGLEPTSRSGRFTVSCLTIRLRYNIWRMGRDSNSQNLLQFRQFSRLLPYQLGYPSNSTKIV